MAVVSALIVPCSSTWSGMTLEAPGPVLNLVEGQCVWALGSENYQVACRKTWVLRVGVIQKQAGIQPHTQAYGF